jgi:DNA-binding NarL/FixJ family response regulator
MRVLIVGAPADRARVRDGLEAAGIVISGEFATLAAARRAQSGADAIVIATVDERDADIADDGDGEEDAAAERLTPRERDVLDLLAEGLPNKAIASRLKISDQTVKFHVAAICGKLGASNRTDAVRRAVRLGLIVL